MRDQQVERLPERIALGERPAVQRTTAIRMIISGVVADLRRLVGRWRGRR